MKSDKKSTNIPPLKLPKTLRGFRGLYSRLATRLKKEQGAVIGVTVYSIEKRNRQQPEKELDVLKKLCHLLWRIIHKPLDPKDAVPEAVGTRL